tara:strand:- start:5379 stop:5684 length:306 start_codon:yes stop_codon:yes gene_type:complete
MRPTEVKSTEPKYENYCKVRANFQEDLERLYDVPLKTLNWGMTLPEEVEKFVSDFIMNLGIGDYFDLKDYLKDLKKTTIETHLRKYAWTLIEKWDEEDSLF